jgi:hypothetical protein
VPIMQQNLVVLISAKRFPELLHSPLRSRMFGHVAVNQPSERKGGPATQASSAEAETVRNGII